MALRKLAAVPTLSGSDGALIQELAGLSTGLTSHSVALIVHPPGTASVAHHHTVADEVYLVRGGRGRLRLDGLDYPLELGDVVTIRPGQAHKVYNAGPADLVLLVTCAPAYLPAEVRWDE